ncbi:MAG: lamin tail domain-containing protein [Nannocystaceae bacterium]|nr:lamin tail domain-containing protein [Nannocystaceae bacterium]
MSARRVATVSCRLSPWLVLAVLASGCPDNPTEATSDTEGSSSSGGEETTTTTETTDADSSTTVVNLCGNGTLDEGEVCDGAEFGDLSCQSQGFLSGELTCAINCKSFGTSMCILSVCGDDQVDGDEVCDGTDLAGEDCISQGFLAGTLACNEFCNAFDTNGCAPNICGNGTIERGEACDSDDLGGVTCVDLGHDEGTLACAGDCSYDESGCIDYSCGDGIVNKDNEECDGEDLAGVTCADGGFGAGAVACSKTCTLDFTGCCGDENRGGDELCDALDFGGQTCADLGDFDDGTLVCAATCDAIDTSACTLCGDDVAEGNEACDGTDLQGLDCTTVPGGFVAGVLACDGSCAIDTTGCNFCGNNTVDPGEDCDDEDLGVGDCLSLGHTGGLIGCAADCNYDESLCTDFPVPQADELYITEIMRDPTAVGDPNGEWFELFNPSGGTSYQLLGCTVQDDGGESFDITSDLVIGPGESITFGRSASPGFTPSFVYGGMVLGNGDDELELFCGGVSIDRVAWTNATFPAPVGASMELDPLVGDATTNDDGSNWCTAGDVYFMGDLGTPGAGNTGCG